MGSVRSGTEGEEICGTGERFPDSPIYFWTALEQSLPELWLILKEWMKGSVLREYYNFNSTVWHIIRTMCVCTAALCWTWDVYIREDKTRLKGWNYFYPPQAKEFTFCVLVGWLNLWISLGCSDLYGWVRIEFHVMVCPYQVLTKW